MRGAVEALGAKAALLGEHASHGRLRGAPGRLHGLHLGHALRVLLLQLLLPHLQAHSLRQLWARAHMLPVAPARDMSSRAQVLASG